MPMHEALEAWDVGESVTLTLMIAFLLSWAPDHPVSQDTDRLNFQLHDISRDFK